MSPGFDEILDAAQSTNAAMDVDTSFLDAYRSGGTEGLQQAQEEAADAEADRGEQKVDDASRADDDKDIGDDVDPVEPETDLERQAERPRDDTSRIDRGGSTSAGGAASTAPRGETPARNEDAPQDADLDEAVAEHHDPAVAPVTPEPGETAETPGSLQLTDHQDDAQSAGVKGGSSSGSQASAGLPSTGFKLTGTDRQPHIKSLPEPIIAALREQLRSAIVRELGASDDQAREFSDRLSQKSLVMAFLLAQLDLRLDVDASTQRAAEMFRIHDPLLGSVVEHLDRMEQNRHSDRVLLQKLHDELDQVRSTSTVIEQAVAYSIADRTENFLRGSHNTEDAPLGHKTAIYIRDRAREAAKKQTTVEAEREGRPIR